MEEIHLAIKEIWQKHFGGPRHLVTIAAAIGEKKQVTINMYFRDPKELFSLVPTASAVIDEEEEIFRQKVEKVNADIAKKLKKENNK